MALTRKFLAALGIEAEKVDEIITAHQETLNDIKAERDRFKEDAEKLPAVQKELDELKAANSETENYREKFEKEQKEFSDYKASVEAKEAKARKDGAIKKLLKDAGIGEKYVDAVSRIYDADSVKLDKDGNIEDAKERLEAVKEAYPEFIEQRREQGAESAKPPKGNGGGDEGRKPSRAAQIAAKYHENIYGKAKEE